MENQTTMLVATEGAKEELLTVTASHRQYCSMNPKTDADKIALYNAVNNPAKHLRDFVNMPISLRHVFAEDCEFVNEEDGTVSNGVRVVLIDDKGESYSCASKGVVSSLTKLFAIFGDARGWKQPMTIVPKMVTKSATKNVLVIELG